MQFLKRQRRWVAGILAVGLMLCGIANASHISGIRISQTGNTGLMVNVDVTAFYTTGSTETTAYLGTYYNQVPAINWGDGSTVPRYGYGPSTGIPLAASSTVVNGIPARSFRGSFSHTYGSPGSYTISAQTSCCPLTTPTYTLVTGAIQTTTVMTSGPFGPTTFTTSFVQNTLDVNAVAPGFSKAFAPSTVGVGNASTLTFTVDNSASTLDNNALDFTDNLPSGLIVATPSNASTTCTGGTLTAASGSGVITYTGGLVPAAASCTVSVDTTANIPGMYANTSGDLTSAFGNSGTASDTLTVTATPPLFSKAFAPASTSVGGVSTLTFTIDNAANAAAASSLDFTDNLPAGLLVAAPANAMSSCSGGTLTAVSGTGTVSYSGGTVAAAASCTVSVDTVADLPGMYANTSGDLTSTFGNSGSASDTLTVTATPPGFSKNFAPASIAVGGVSTLTFTIDNSANGAPATLLDFTDSLPAGTLVATPANAATTCTGGTLTATQGGSSVTYTGGTVAAGASCTVSADITSATMGSYMNTSGDLTSSFGNSGAASDTLTVSSTTLLFNKQFTPSTVGVGEPGTLTFTLDNTNAVDATSVDFADTFPAGMLVAAVPNTVDTCGGVLTGATAGSGTLGYTGGTVAGLSACTVSVDVAADTAGTYNNTTGSLTSNFGDSGTASDTLIVTSSVLAFTKQFNPSVVPANSPSTLTFTLTNSNAVDASSVDFTDTFPVGLVVAATPGASNTCGGTFTGTTTGSGSVGLSGGLVAANSTCTVSVDVSAPTSDTFDNVSGSLTSSFGDSGTASATLTVQLAPTFSAAVMPTTVPAGVSTTLTYTIDNSANGVSAMNLAFSDSLPTGMQVAGAAVSTCGGTVSAAVGSGQVNLSGGTVGPNASCTVTLQVVSYLPGQFTNDLPSLSSSLGTATASGTAPVLVVLSPTAVPLMSGIGLIIMSLLIILVAWRRGSGFGV